MQGSFNPNSGVGSQFQLFAEDVYSIEPNILGEFRKDGKTLLAKREKLELARDSVYKTMFVNPEIRNSIKPLNENTKIILYDKDENEINSLTNLPELKPEYSAIIFQVEPVVKPAYISIVIYKGPTKEKVFLNDGSTTMDDEYIPIKPTDVVTKGYADDLIEDFTSSIYPIKTFEIYQNEKPLPVGYSYTDNKKLEVIYIRDIYGNSTKDCKLKVAPFAIPNNFSDEVFISVYFNGYFSHKEKIRDILNGASSEWKCTDSENIYTGKVDTLFWKNTFELTFNPDEYFYYFNQEDPVAKIRVVIAESGMSSMSDEKEYGLDYYIEKAEKEIEVTYREMDLEKERTKYLSGNSYFQPDWEKKYELPFDFSVVCSFLNFFRPENFCNIQIKLKDDSLYDFDSFGSSLHTPKGKLNLNRVLVYDLNIKSFILNFYNLSQEFMFSEEVPLNVETDISEELYRVKTTDAEDQFPEAGYGGWWNPEAKVKDYDPILHNGVYESDSEKSAICFKFPCLDCYSHAMIDIEHDGEMYIKVEGRTNWLSAEEQLKLFGNPIKNGDGCLVNNNYYSFGKVIYKEPVFVRVLKASKVKFNGYELN